MNIDWCGHARSHLILVALAYGLLFGSCLWVTGGFPYVLDNNESFSSLWHARNLYDFGLARSWGLADESFSPHAGAHPYVHTHQGNFPRLFAFALYVLGARDITSQIVLTTFTVGLASVLLMFRFFSELATPRFGAIACIVFMTDYVLFSQWQMVTYRVWHTFLLFCCLYSAFRASQGSLVRWRLSLAISFTCLFYFELIFAAFVALFCTLFLLWLLRRTPRAAFALIMVQSAGALAGLSVFVSQAVGYLGYENFVRDIYLTFLARNDANNAATLMSEAANFYENKHVIFWHNWRSRDDGSGMLEFVRSLTAFDWQMHTPLFSTTVGIIFVGSLLSLMPGTTRAFDADEPSRQHAWLDKARTQFAYLILLSGMLLFAYNGQYSDSVGHGKSLGALSGLVFGIFVTLGCASLIAALRLSQKHVASDAPSHRDHTLIMQGALLCIGGILLPHLPMLFDNSFDLVWASIYGISGAPAFVSLILTASVLVSIAGTSIGAGRILGINGREQLHGAFVYLGCGVLAYGVVFFLSPGYVVSGYLARSAPFTVFITDAVVAVALYFMVGVVRVLLEEALASYREATIGTPTARTIFGVYTIGTAAVFSIGALLFVIAFWFSMQVKYVRWLPPDHFSFLGKFSAAPYAGSSTVVNHYAAPVAAFTGQWSYFDERISQAQLAVSGDQIHLAGDRKYLWFADHNTNIDYRTPKYFICMIPQSLRSVRAHVDREAGQGPGAPSCSDLPLLRTIQRSPDLLPGFNLKEVDSVGPDRIGFSSWAIVDLNWGVARGGVVLDWNARPLRPK